MSQTATPPATRHAGPGAAGPTAVPVGRRPQLPGDRAARAVAALRAGVEGTPGRMRLLTAVTVLAGLLLALVGLQAFRSMDGALQRADADAQQLVRLQDLSSSLVRADADATSAFLVGGLEPIARRTDYLTSLDHASRQISAAATAQPADAQLLGRLASDVVTYAGLVEQARATNRQALPVGGQYLRDAGAGLRADALPVLDTLVAANTHRVQVELDHARLSVVVLLVVGVLALGVLVGTLLWLARRTHRYLNVGVAGAAVLALAVLVVGTVVLVSARGAAQQVRSGSYAATSAVSSARAAAYDAKANESLTLIARGSGGAFEKAWAASSQRTVDLTARSRGRYPVLAEQSGLWQAYVTSHQKVRALDDAGRSDEAVALALGDTAKAFAAYDARSASFLHTVSRDTSRGFDDARSGLTVGGWLVALAGVLVAALCWWGISQRLEEYR